MSPLSAHLALCATGACFGFPFLAGGWGELGLVEVSGPSHPRWDVNLLRSAWGHSCPLWGVSELCKACAEPRSALSAGSLLPGWACHRCRVKSLRAALGHVCHKPGPLLWLCIHPSCSGSADICGSGFAGKRDILGKPRALRWDRQQERSGIGLAARRSAAFFLLRAPWLWGQRELVSAGRGSSLQQGA